MFYNTRSVVAVYNSNSRLLSVSRPYWNEIGTMANFIHNKYTNNLRKMLSVLLYEKPNYFHHKKNFRSKLK